MSITISVTTDQMAALADLISEIDEAKEQPQALAAIVEKGHDIIIGMLGQYEFMVYAPEDDAPQKEQEAA